MATIEQRLAEYKDLFGKAQSYDMNQYQQDFQKAYNEAMDYNKDLIGQKSAALGELQAVAPTMRERYANSLITDPTRQMSLIAQARQAPITDWGQAVDLLGARGAKYSDILGKAVGGYQTAADQANIARENAWRLYQDAVQQEQFQQQLRKSSGGGGDSSLGIKDILDMLGSGGTSGATVDPVAQNKQSVMNAINNIKLLRQSKNVESKMPQYHKDIMNQAKSLGLNLNSEALWQQLGNTPKNAYQTYNLFI